MSKKRILNLGIAWISAVALILAVALLFQVPDASSQGPGESDIEADKALAAEQQGHVERQIETFPLSGVFPLFMGVDDPAVPAYLMDPNTNISTTAFVGADVYGAAYDPVNDIVYFNDGATLYEWPVGGAINPLGTVVDGAGATQVMVGLAFYNGQLYGTKNIANEAIWAINPGTLVANVFIDYVDADLDCGGFSADPNNGTFYCTNDDSTPHGSGLVIVNPDASVTHVTAYPAGETDVDGLAVSDDGIAYLVIDQPGSIYVYDIVGGAYLPNLTNPWTTSEVFSGGAWVAQIISQPGIALSKTVGTDPNSCAVTPNISVYPGTDVTYCYEVTNTGTVELTVHELDDSELGTILSGFAFTLAPGASAFITETTNIITDTVNVATWTACNIDGPPTLTCFDGAAFDVVSATATANVTVIPFNPSIALTKTVGLDNGTCATTDNLMVGQPSTEVYYCYTVRNTGDVTFTTHDLYDDQLGSLLTAEPYVLGPGDTFSLYPVSETITTSVTNIATWTAYIDTPTYGPVTAQATDSATVTEQPTDVSLNSFSGSSNGFLLPVMMGLLALLVVVPIILVRRLQNKN